MMLTFIWIIAFSVLAISYRKDRARTLAGVEKTFRSLGKLSPTLLAMVVFVGLALAAVPAERLAALFAIKGVWGFVVVSLVGAVVTIPGPIAFPLAGALLHMGAAPAILASFITTLTMVGLTTAPMEISYFGARFTALRQFFSLLAAIAIGQVMGVLL
jgi:uncharacterized membrane protein YraQ (UPF0718 family)